MKSTEKGFCDKKNVRILVIDNHQLFREGLSLLLASRPQIEIVGNSSPGPEAISLAVETNPDLIILDLDSRSWAGGEPVTVLCDSLPGVHILILTACTDERLIHAALERGAEAVICKVDAFSEMDAAIRVVREGHRYLSPKISDIIVDSYVDIASEMAAEPEPGAGRDPARRVGTAQRDGSALSVGGARGAASEDLP